MGSKSVSNIEVRTTETEIMDPTMVDSKANKRFTVDNGENEIIATAWGSKNGIDWIQKDEKTIGSNENGILVVGPNHCINVKLTGRTTAQTAISSVDATLTW